MKGRKTEGPSGTTHHDAREKEEERWGRKSGGHRGEQTRLEKEFQVSRKPWCTFPNILKHIYKDPYFKVCWHFMCKQQTCGLILASSILFALEERQGSEKTSDWWNCLLNEPLPLPKGHNKLELQETLAHETECLYEKPSQLQSF